MNKISSLIMLVVALGVSLSGCKDNKPVDAAEQVAVKVNGQPIMAVDFGVKPGLGGSGQMLQGVSASDMKLMVELELLRQAAVQSGLDRDEGIRAQLARSPGEPPRKTLAMAYVNKALSGVPAPTEAEVGDFFNGNPARFAERKHYELQACIIKPVDGMAEKIKSQLDKSMKFDDFERWLKANKVKHGSVPVTTDADQLGDPLLQRLRGITVGGSVVEDGDNQMTITFVRAMQDAPLALDQAKPQIIKMLTDRRRSESYANMVKQLHDQAKIEYVSPYTANGLAALAVQE